MLVLTRKENERILIGGDIVVTVLDFSGQFIRLGITAPRDVPIYRQEVLERLTDHERRELGHGNSDSGQSTTADHGTPPDKRARRRRS